MVTQRELHEDWMKANINPVFWKGKKDPGNCRLVCLTSAPGEVIQELTLETISSHVKDKKIVSRSSQWGWPNAGADCPGNCGVSVLGDIQKPWRHGLQQLVLGQPAWAGSLEHDLQRSLWNLPSLWFCERFYNSTLPHTTSLYMLDNSTCWIAFCNTCIYSIGFTKP